MTPEERDRMDLERLERLEDVDMSPEAVTARMQALDRLWQISILIDVPYISFFERSEPTLN
jgi:hypothetical protein